MAHATSQVGDVKTMTEHKNKGTVDVTADTRSSHLNFKGMILAAGFGTRLGPLGEVYPKPLLPVHGVPLAEYALRMMSSAGITEVAVNLHYKSGVIRQILGDGSRFGVTITYFHEDEILGTGGALRNVREWMADSHLLVMNGKVITDVDLASVMELHQTSGATGTMVLRPDPNAARWGAIGADTTTGKIVSILGDKGTPHMFTGISVVSPEFISVLPDGPSCSVRNGWIPLLEQGAPLKAHIMGSSDYWWEHSTPQRYLLGNINLFDKNLRSHFPWLPPMDGSTVILAGAKVPDDTDVSESVIHPETHIAPGIRVRRSILLPGAEVQNDMYECVAFRGHLLRIDLHDSDGFTGPKLGTPESRR